MNTQEIARRVLAQRMQRYMDAGPSLAPAGTARFRMEPGRLRVAYASARPGEAAEVVRGVLRFAHQRQMQVHWSVVPERTGEEDLTPALLAANFESIESLLLMGHADLVRPDIPLNPRVTIRPIHTWYEMYEYESHSRQCFYGDEHPSDALISQRATERWREQEHNWCRYFRALLDGAPVGGCYVSLFEDIPTIMGVCTVPEARRQGVASALVAHAISSVITREHRLSCLFVEQGNPAEHLYRQLGFAPVLNTITYAWTPA
ncbi:MAG: hypothetical protein OJF49_003874 [Ktedonobacterales bacterium]|jgi:GNAT superfamily N-acetyltransferase|nr:MAG: hypothetical protein OJF49_003874 [Ktedonobacterales bacterium]